MRKYLRRHISQRKIALDDESLLKLRLRGKREQL